MEPSASRKKRGRKSDGSDSDGERRRGRPRVEKQDESAADRRRTQIRMAQRAYRQRKESTLEELRKRVSELTNTIELMNKSYGDCRDRLLATDLSQDQMMDLQDVATQFESFVKEARNPSDEDVGHPQIVTDRSSAPSNTAESRTETFDEARNVPSWLDQSAVQSVAKRSTANRVDIGMGYQMLLPEADDNFETMEYSSFDAQTGQMAPLESNQQLGKQNSFEPLPLEVQNDDFLHTAQLELPRTYSFQESTFGRRVFRAAIEKAYHLLLDPRRKPIEYERCFRLSLMGRDRAKMIAAFKTLLDRGPHEDLNFWQAPLIHVGGAGTHYQRRDPFGNLQPRRKSHNLGIIGPQTLALLENAARDNISTDMTVEVAGFEGEWFDPYDVQGYLEEKGIFIDPSASFAEADIVEWSPTSSSTSSGGSSLHPQTPTDVFANRQKSTPFTVNQVAHLSDLGADLGQWNDFTDMELGGVGFSDAQMGSWMNFLQPGESIREINVESQLNNLSGSDNWKNINIDALQHEVEKATLSANIPQSQQTRPRKKTVIIDVAKFVEVLIVSGVCLGRSPGFRRRDVDRALAISSFEA